MLSPWHISGQVARLPTAFSRCWFSGSLVAAGQECCKLGHKQCGVCTVASWVAHRKTLGLELSALWGFAWPPRPQPALPARARSCWGPTIFRIGGPGELFVKVQHGTRVTYPQDEQSRRPTFVTQANLCFCGHLFFQAKVVTYHRWLCKPVILFIWCIWCCGIG